MSYFKAPKRASLSLATLAACAFSVNAFAAGILTTPDPATITLPATSVVIQVTHIADGTNNGVDAIVNYDTAAFDTTASADTGACIANDAGGQVVLSAGGFSTGSDTDLCKITFTRTTAVEANYALTFSGVTFATPSGADTIDDGQITIQAVPPVQHTVTATAGAGGGVAPATQDVNEGSTANVTVTPNAGFEVTAISGCGGTAAGLPSSAAVVYTTAAVMADCAVTASFGAIPAPVYSSSPAPGPVSCSGAPGSTTNSVINVNNTGNAPLNIASCTFASGVNFTVNSFTGTPIAGGGSGTINVSCTVPAEGSPANTDTLTCSHDATGSPATYAYSAAAVTVPPPVPTPDLVPASSLWSKLMLFGFLAGLGALVISLRRS